MSITVRYAFVLFIHFGFRILYKVIEDHFSSDLNSSITAKAVSKMSK